VRKGGIETKEQKGWPSRWAIISSFTAAC